MQIFSPRLGVLAVIVLAVTGGCQPLATAPTTTSVPVMSQWGRVWAVAQAPQTAAPAFTAHVDHLMFAWVGSDAAGVHQDVRMLNQNGWSVATALPLNPIRPDGLLTFAAAMQHTHLLYLDEHLDSGETRLFHALVRPDLSLKIGGTLLSPQRVTHYSAMSMTDNALWVVWSGGLRSEPRLYARYIDPAGRPRPPLKLTAAIDAEYPSLIRGMNGELWLFWLHRKSNMIYRAALNPQTGELSQSTSVAESLRLATGERLIYFSAAADLTHGYLVWNTVYADGTPRTYIASDEWDAASWLMRPSVSVAIPAEPDFQTGYNGGAAYTLQQGDVPVKWVAPVAQSNERLLAAAVIGDQLGVTYWQAGQIIAFQPVIRIESGLIGLPHLTTDRERHLYLAWSAPVRTDSADLLFTTTRPYSD